MAVSSPSPHRVLKVFLSRTAQRIPYMTSWRVLRLLAIILLLVCWFLVAWTAAVCQHPDRKWALIDVGYTPDGLQFSMCLLDRWDYMTAVGKKCLSARPGGRIHANRKLICQAWLSSEGGRRTGEAAVGNPSRCSPESKMLAGVGQHAHTFHTLFYIC